MAKKNIRTILRENAVTIMFVVLCIIGLYFSGQSVSFVMYELFGRISRNAFLVLALIIPIIAGMGINFAVTIGAMAAQISAPWIVERGIGGLAVFMPAVLMTRPIAAVFGFSDRQTTKQDERAGDDRWSYTGLFRKWTLSAVVPFHIRQHNTAKCAWACYKRLKWVANTINLRVKTA